VEQAPDLDDLQRRLGHRFVDPTLLERALTHRSWAHDQTPPERDYERLEFLGDAVLGVIVAEKLFSMYPHDEGHLTRARSGLVRKEHLSSVAQKLELGQHLRLGKGEEASGGRDKPSILSDVFEAVLGAVHLDGGLEAARSLVLRTMDQAFHEGAGLEAPRDARTLLQEHLQQLGRGTPSYRIVRSEGPPHAPTWTQEVVVAGEVLGRGVGPSKQQAARAAARQALAVLTEPPAVDVS